MVSQKRREMNVPMKQRKMSATEEERAMAAAAVGQPEGRAAVEPFTAPDPQEMATINAIRADLIDERTKSAVQEERELAAGAEGDYEWEVVGSPMQSGTVRIDGPHEGYPAIQFLDTGQPVWEIGRDGATPGLYVFHYGPPDQGAFYITPEGQISFRGPIGFGGPAMGPGVGGTVTQLSSKATPVQIDKVCGSITTHAASLAANTAVAFAVNNNQVAAGDVIILNKQIGGATYGSYGFAVDNVTTGAFVITIRNLTAGALAEALSFNFAVIKAVAS